MKQRGVFEKSPGSGDWWIRYIDATGKLRREKAGTKSAAVNLYRKRKTQAMEGKKLPENLRSVTKVSDLAPAILRDYEVNGKKSKITVDRRLRKHLLPYFGGMAADDLGTEDLNRYIDRRKKAGAENGTINRELAVVKRMYKLARTTKPSRVREIPVFPHLKENPPRQGFVEDRNYSVLMEHAEELWLKAIIEVAYSFGFRKSELLVQMKVGQVDLATRSLTLYAGTTKNDEGRVVKMTEAVYELLRACVKGKSSDDYVFSRSNGEPVRDFRGAWWTLCKKARLGKFVKSQDRKGKKRSKWQGLIFHDLRRSAVRNMVRCGIPERVAMKISGHKTRAVFDRYNIASEADITEAAYKIERARQRNLGDGTAEPTDTRTDTSSKPAPEAYVMATD